MTMAWPQWGGQGSWAHRGPACLLSHQAPGKVLGSACSSVLDGRHVARLVPHQCPLLPPRRQEDVAGADISVRTNVDLEVFIRLFIRIVTTLSETITWLQMI